MTKTLLVGFLGAIGSKDAPTASCCVFSSFFKIISEQVNKYMFSFGHRLITHTYAECFHYTGFIRDLLIYCLGFTEINHSFFNFIALF